MALNPYLYTLRTMGTCGQYGIIQKYNEEATKYQRQNTYESVGGDVESIPHILVCIQNKMIGLLEQMLNDGSLPLDVAFCQLIVWYGYIDCDCLFYHQYGAFLLRASAASPLFGSQSLPPTSLTH
eukprot:311317_1